MKDHHDRHNCGYKNAEHLAAADCGVKSGEASLDAVKRQALVQAAQPLNSALKL